MTPEGYVILAYVAGLLLLLGYGAMLLLSMSRGCDVESETRRMP